MFVDMSVLYMYEPMRCPAPSRLPRPHVCACMCRLTWCFFVILFRRGQCVCAGGGGMHVCKHVWALPPPGTSSAPPPPSPTHLMLLVIFLRLGEQVLVFLVVDLKHAGLCAQSIVDECGRYRVRVWEMWPVCAWLCSDSSSDCTVLALPVADLKHAGL